MYNLKYLGADYMHNIHSNKLIKEFANGEYYCCILLSPTNNNTILAIPRNYIYNYINCDDLSFLCDIFKVNKCLSYKVTDGKIHFENEAEIRDWALSFTRDICTIQRNIADVTTATFAK